MLLSGLKRQNILFYLFIFLLGTKWHRIQQRNKRSKSWIKVTDRKKSRQNCKIHLTGVTRLEIKSGKIKSRHEEKLKRRENNAEIRFLPFRLENFPGGLSRLKKNFFSKMIKEHILPATTKMIYQKYNK